MTKPRCRGGRRNGDEMGYGVYKIRRRLEACKEAKNLDLENDSSPHISSEHGLLIFHCSEGPCGDSDRCLLLWLSVDLSNSGQ